MKKVLKVVGIGIALTTVAAIIRAKGENNFTIYKTPNSSLAFTKDGVKVKGQSITLDAPVTIK